jgi:hypothetical protein
MPYTGVYTLLQLQEAAQHRALALQAAAPS